MSNRPSRVSMSVYAPSADGRFYPRYPYGNAPPPGAAFSALALAVSGVLGTLATGAGFSSQVRALSTSLASLTTVPAPIAAQGQALAVGSASGTLNYGAVGYDGTIKVQGNKLVNGSGNVVQLRGANMSGLEYVAPEGWSPADPWGGITPAWSTYQTWKPNVVRFPLTAASWLGYTCGITGTQAVTFTATPASGSTNGTLTAAWTLASGVYPITMSGGNGATTTATFTNGSTAVTWPALGSAQTSTAANVAIWASTRSADPGSNYQATVKAAVAAAQAIGCYVILDLHFCCPQITIGGVTHYLMPIGQSAFADQTAIAFWTSIANTFGTQATPPSGVKNTGILFELFNEPYLNSNGYTLTTTQGGSTTVSADLALLNGGWSSALINNSQGGSNFVLNLGWQLAGYQAMLNAIRATGAQNVCIVNGNAYSGNTKNFATWHPTDTLATPQIAHGWHPYANTYNGANPYPYTAYGPYVSCGTDSNYAAPSSTDINYALSILTAGYPLLATEYGDQGGTTATATPYAEPACHYLQAAADTYGFSAIHWQWNGTRSYGTTSSQHYSTVYASDGTTILPILGEGTTINDWMVAHAP